MLRALIAAIVDKILTCLGLYTTDQAFAALDRLADDHETEVGKYRIAAASALVNAKRTASAAAVFAAALAATASERTTLKRGAKTADPNVTLAIGNAWLWLDELDVHYSDVLAGSDHLLDFATEEICSDTLVDALNEVEQIVAGAYADHINDDDHLDDVDDCDDDCDSDFDDEDRFFDDLCTGDPDNCGFCG